MSKTPPEKFINQEIRPNLKDFSRRGAGEIGKVDLKTVFNKPILEQDGGIPQVAELSRDQGAPPPALVNR